MNLVNDCVKWLGNLAEQYGAIIDHVFLCYNL